MRTAPKIVITLGDNKANYASEIARKIMMTESQIRQIIKQLITKQIIEKQTQNENNRNKTLQLTSKGIEIYKCLKVITK